jgi:hypothetical protein
LQIELLPLLKSEMSGSSSRSLRPSSRSLRLRASRQELLTAKGAKKTSQRTQRKSFFSHGGISDCHFRLKVCRSGNLKSQI